MRQLRIKEWRAIRGWTQSELARRLPRTRSYVCRVEQGSLKPSLRALEQFATVLEVEVTELFHGPRQPHLPTELAVAQQHRLRSRHLALRQEFLTLCATFRRLKRQLDSLVDNPEPEVSP